MEAKLSKSVFWLFIVLLSVSLPVFAEGDEDEEEVIPSIYVAVDPAFVTNYGGPGRLRYMKVEVSLRVKGPDAGVTINYHLSNIKDALLCLPSVQSLGTIGKSGG